MRIESRGHFFFIIVELPIVGTSSHISSMISEDSPDLCICTRTFRIFVTRAPPIPSSGAFSSLAPKINLRASSSPFVVHEF